MKPDKKKHTLTHSSAGMHTVTLTHALNFLFLLVSHYRSRKIAHLTFNSIAINKYTFLIGFAPNTK